MKLLPTQCVAYDSLVSNHFVRRQTTGDRATNKEQKSLTSSGNKECYFNTRTFLARRHLTKVSLRFYHEEFALSVMSLPFPGRLVVGRRGNATTHTINLCDLFLWKI
jgi:hypothetical protein